MKKKIVYLMAFIILNHIIKCTNTQSAAEYHSFTVRRIHVNVPIPKPLRSKSYPLIPANRFPGVQYKLNFSLPTPPPTLPTSLPTNISFQTIFHLLSFILRTNFRTSSKYWGCCLKRFIMRYGYGFCLSSFVLE